MPKTDPFRVTKGKPPTMDAVVGGILDNDILVGELLRKLAWLSPTRLTDALLRRIEFQTDVAMGRVGPCVAGRIACDANGTGDE